MNGYRAGLLFILCHTLYAATPDCLIQFASVSAHDPDGVAATAVTYDRLLDTLGGKLTQATLKKMLEGKDPFAVPEQPGTDLHALQSRLREFEAMLTERKWRSPETTGRLLSRLITRVKQVTAHAEKTANATAEAKDWVFEGKADRPTTAISPDGRWLVMLPYLGENVTSTLTNGVLLRITDMATGATREVNNPHRHDYTGRLAFGPDGKTLLFITHRWNILSVPFEDGVPHWEATVVSPHPFTRDGISPARPGENSNYAFADRPDPIVRMNVLTKKEDRIRFSGEVTKDHFYSGVRRVGSVGQSENIYLVLESDAYDGRIVVFDMAPDGKATGHRVVAEWTNRERFHGLAWTADGKPITLNGNKFYEWSSATEPKQIMETTGIAPWNKKTQNPDRWDVRTHATGAVVLYSDNGASHWVEVFDFREKKRTATIALPKGTEVISLSPDGQRLIVKVGPNVHVMNYRMRE